MPPSQPAQPRDLFSKTARSQLLEKPPLPEQPGTATGLRPGSAPPQPQQGTRWLVPIPTSRISASAQPSPLSEQPKRLQSKRMPALSSPLRQLPPPAVPTPEQIYSSFLSSYFPLIGTLINQGTRSLPQRRAGSLKSDDCGVIFTSH